MPECWATTRRATTRTGRASKLQILSFAREVNERERVGCRGAVLLSNGETMVEEPTIGKQRAEQVSMLLQGANLRNRQVRPR